MSTEPLGPQGNLDPESEALFMAFPHVPRTREQELAWLAESWRRAREMVPEDVPLNRRVFGAIPWGRRVVVRRVPADRKFGVIHIPDTARQPNVVGWVLSVGPLVSDPDPTHFQNVAPYAHPLQLVGRKVIWPKYSGITLKESAHDFDVEEATDYIYIRIDEIHFTVLDEDPAEEIFDETSVDR